MDLVWDIEANGLLMAEGSKPAADTIWMIVAQDPKTEEVYIFADAKTHVEKNGDLADGLKFLSQARVLAGHNIIGYDIPVLKKFYGWTPGENQVVMDTMLMSQTLDYKRFPSGRHALGIWGEYFKFPKGDFKDFDRYSDEMLDYCIQDVRLNTRVFQYLMAEFKQNVEKKPLLKQSLRVEHDVAQFCADAFEHGWQFDRPKAEALLEEMGAKLKEIEDDINPRLKPFFKPKDAEDKRIKSPKWIKNGNYDSHTAKWFDIDPVRGKEDRPVIGEYCRIEFVEPDVGSMDAVKEFLYSIGWEPLDWNWEVVFNNGRKEFRKKSAKLCSESLAKLGTIGEQLDFYYTTRSRHSILKGWVRDLDEDNRLHGRCFTIATPTGRARHSGIVNVPGAKALWGKEMRELFIAKPGYTVVGSDSSGNQFRALAHYLKNPEFTESVINGSSEDGTDVHSRNAQALGCDRNTAKPWIYAFLFGAGDEKLGLVLTGVRDKAAGRESRLKFAKAIPGFQELITKLQEVLHKTQHLNKGNGFIPALDGRRIYTESAHKALNYLLQSAEAITCKAAVAYAMNKIKEEGLDAKPLIFYHDECEWEVKEGQEERVAEICAEAFREAPKQFLVECMDGESKTGANWYEVH